ncbi:MAG TPA: ACP phosphodiesterase [Cyclobacteriaceae bacterium]|nr:ACP phosphodiesterase [Cyclobacteriaceae bacterium]
MNFLAHLYLSGDDPEVMVGNFIGDFVKGRDLRSRFRPGIAAGIGLHRAIDEYTDGHPVVDRSKQRLRPELRHYSPVVADMFYDHFLAANWSRYHTEPLPRYAAGVYRLLESYHDVLPAKVKEMLPYMVRGNWLVSYSRIEGIQRALSGMAARTPYESGMETATHLLRTHYERFEEDFTEFFPDLTRFAEEYRNDQGMGLSTNAVN